MDGEQCFWHNTLVALLDRNNFDGLIATIKDLMRTESYNEDNDKCVRSAQSVTMNLSWCKKEKLSLTLIQLYLMVTAGLRFLACNLKAEVAIRGLEFIMGTFFTGG